MSIASEIERIKSNISNAYSECESKNATMPDIQNSENLPNTIASITTGITPAGTTYIYSNGFYDVREYESANVHVEYDLQNKTVIPTKEEQTIKADVKYYGLNEVTVQPIPDEYIIPSGVVNITENGEYDIEDKKTALVNVPTGGGSQYPIIEGTGKYEVKFIDMDGTVLKTHYVNKGEDATPPEVPEHNRLTFFDWNNDYTNIQRDTYIGTLYNNVSGDIELHIRLTEETGLTLDLNISNMVTGNLLTIDWGDSSNVTRKTLSTSAVNTFNKTYDEFGDYIILLKTTYFIEFGGGTNTTALLGNPVNSKIQDALIKIYGGNKFRGLKSYALIEAHNLEEFVMGDIQADISFYSYNFYSRKLKSLIMPKRLTYLQSNIIFSCPSLRYLVLNDNLKTITFPIVTGCCLEKLILPKSYNSYTSLAQLSRNSCAEKIIYPKSSNTYTFGTTIAQYNGSLKEVSMYDNLTSIGANTFAYTGIEKISIPPSVTTINAGVFSNCRCLKDVYMYSHTPPKLSSSTVFTNTSPNLILHVYPEDLETYQATTNYTGIATKIVGDLEGEFEEC